MLKPFSFDRFFTAVNKVVDKMNTKTPKTIDEFILIKADKKLHKIAVSSIIYIEAFGDYVKIHQKDHFLLTNATFNPLGTWLVTDIMLRWTLSRSCPKPRRT